MTSTIGMAPGSVQSLRTGVPGDVVSAVDQAARVVNEGVTFVDSALSTAGAIAQDPTGWLTSAGLGFLLSLVSPLEDAIQMVSGDGDSLRQSSGQFGDTRAALESMSRDVVRLADHALAGWEGDAALAGKRMLAGIADDLDSAAGKSDALDHVLQMSAVVMEVVEDVVRSILTEFVDWLIMTWLPALASAAFTFGGSTASAGAVTAVKALTTTAETARQVNDVQRVLTSLDNVLPDLAIELSRTLGREIADLQAAHKAGNELIIERPAVVPPPIPVEIEGTAEPEKDRFKNAQLQAAFENNPPMSRGSSGRGVMISQMALRSLGYPMPISFPRGDGGDGVFDPDDADGIFGEETEGAVRRFQADHGLQVDGRIGPDTLVKLHEEFKAHEKERAERAAQR